MKKIIILKHSGGELANQLWNYASVYAYSLEKNVECENHSFFEYARFFDIHATKNKVIYSLFFISFRNFTGRRNSLRTRFFRTLYKAYVFMIHIVKSSSIISSENSANRPFYLPPSPSTEQRLFEVAEQREVLYFEGWLFRNPDGLIKYRNEITRYFKPDESIRSKTTSLITPLRKQFSHIVGVHIRQGDYANFKSGRYLINTSRVFEVLKEYIQRNNKQLRDVVFVVASDGDIDTSDFPGLNIVQSDGNSGEDLFTLAATDTIIGSDSSYGNLAAYLGNVPHIVITREPIDWEYYHGKASYFPTKYCTMVHY
ncbi:MAG: alpha-1,2-fucosyltransferase [Minisyncoccota bacterium]